MYSVFTYGISPMLTIYPPLDLYSSACACVGQDSELPTAQSISQLEFVCRVRSLQMPGDTIILAELAAAVWVWQKPHC